MGKTWIKALVALCACGLSASTFALPSFARVVSGEATFIWGLDTLTVEAVGNTTIEWNTFNLSTTERLYFNQASVYNWVWNTILDSAPVHISGAITSNGGLGFAAAHLRLNGLITVSNTLSMETGGGACGARVSSGVTVSTPWATRDLNRRCVLPIDLPAGDDAQLPAWGGVVISSIPEPGTHAMLLAGFGVIGLLSRRKSVSIGEIAG